MLKMHGIKKVYRTSDIQTTAFKQYQPRSKKWRVRRDYGAIGLRKVHTAECHRYAG